MDGDAIDVDGTVRLSVHDSADRNVGRRLTAVERALREARQRQPQMEAVAAATATALHAADATLRDAQADSADATRAHHRAHTAATETARRHQRHDGEARAIGGQQRDTHERLVEIEQRLQALAPRIDESEREVARLSEDLDQAGGAAAGTAQAEARLAALEAALGVNERRAAELRAQAGPSNDGRGRGADRGGHP